MVAKTFFKQEQSWGLTLPYLSTKQGSIGGRIYTWNSMESKIGARMCGQFSFDTHSLMGRRKSFQQTAGTAVSTQRQNRPDLRVKAAAAKPSEENRPETRLEKALGQKQEHLQRRHTGFAHTVKLISERHHWDFLLLFSFLFLFENIIFVSECSICVYT